jgi:GntR family transcriptional regulator
MRREATRTVLSRGGAPFYRQLADDLRARILDGEFSLRDPIPTEARLSDAYRTSRITVRHALALLEQEGLVHREQGRGSFVRPRTIAVGPRRLTSFSQELRERGVAHASRLIALDEVALPADVPLDLDGSGRALRIERVRFADQRPIAHQVTHIPADLGAGIETRLREGGSLYASLREAHGLDVDSADETYRVAGASREAAALLSVAPGAPVFVVERVGFARARRVEWTLSVVRGEDYEVHVHLRR